MKNKNFYTIITVTLILFLVGCSAQEVPPTPTLTKLVQTVPTPMNEPDEVAALVEEVQNEQDEGDKEPATESTSEETVAEEPPVKDEYCITCHTDPTALMDTAAPIEVVESENEGEG